MNTQVQTTEHHAANNVLTLVVPPTTLYQVVAWDVGDDKPTILKSKVYSRDAAIREAKNFLLYDVAEYTGVKDLTKSHPFWDTVFTVKGGKVVEAPEAE